MAIITILAFQTCKIENTDTYSKEDELTIILPIIFGVLILLVSSFLLVAFLVPSLKRKIFKKRKVKSLSTKLQDK